MFCRPRYMTIAQLAHRTAYTVVIAALISAGCSNGKSSSPLAPSPADPPPPAATTLFRVSGLVTDQAAAEPVAAAHVEIVDGPRAGTMVETDADGHYLVEELSPGAVSLRATAQGFEPVTANVTVSDDRVLDFELTRSVGQGPAPGPLPEQRWSLAGTATDAGSGTPLSAVVVEWTQGANAGQRATTHADGRYAFADLEAGSGEIRAVLAGFVPQALALNLDADRTLDIVLLREAPTGPEVTGRVIGALSSGPIAGVSVHISGGGTTTTDADGAFVLAGSAGGTQRVTLTSDDTVERQTGIRLEGDAPTVTLIPRSLDLRAFNEMFRTRGGLHRWIEAPRLVVQRRVMAFTNTTDTTYVATATMMSEAEVDALLADLRWALPQLTGDTFTDFATVEVELAAEGDMVTVTRPGTIVAGRYDGLDAAINAWGYGRWAWSGNGEVKASVMMLDDAFDRSDSASRRSLRAHELGHTLGYDHVSSGVSVMHQSGRVEPTGFDRDAARIAFLRQPLNAAPDIDPDPITVNRLASHGLSWTGAR